MLGTLCVDSDGGWLGEWVVPADILDDTAVTRRPSVGHYHAIAWGAFHTYAHKANLYHVFGMLPFFCLLFDTTPDALAQGNLHQHSIWFISVSMYQALF
jgi:hypothetical protein